MKNKKEPKIIFNKELDSSMNGYALSITFLLTGIFLFRNPSYLGVSQFSYFIGAVVGIIGVFGAGIELSKSIKGMDNLVIGSLAISIWIGLYFKVNNKILNFFALALLIIGLYAVILGIIQGIYSIINSNAKKFESKSKKQLFTQTFSQIIIFLTQLAGLGVALLNLLKAINT